MSFRSFRDSRGVEWMAWDVNPEAVDRRIADRRLLREPTHEDRRTTPRRLRTLGRLALSSAFAQGWLCFEASTERRRLIPIPNDWPRCGDDQLEHYCDAARRVPVIPVRPPEVDSRTR